MERFLRFLDEITLVTTPSKSARPFEDGKSRVEAVGRAVFREPPRSKNFAKGTSDQRVLPATPMITQVPTRSRAQSAVISVSGFHRFK